MFVQTSLIFTTGTSFYGIDASCREFFLCQLNELLPCYQGSVFKYKVLRMLVP